MTTTLHLKENKNLLAFSEHEHSIQKTKTSIKTNGKIFPFFLCLLLYVPPAVVVFCILFSLCRILPPLKLFMYSSKSRGFFLSFLFDPYVVVVFLLQFKNMIIIFIY